MHEDGCFFTSPLRETRSNWLLFRARPVWRWRIHYVYCQKDKVVPATRLLPAEFLRHRPVAVRAARQIVLLPAHLSH